jgi:hypothetical protein
MAMAEDRLTQLMGVGYAGEIRQAPTGDLYEWTEGIDGLGNPVGFWKLLRKMAPRIRTALRRGQLLPIARLLPSLIPGWGPAIAAGLTTATPLLRRVGLAGANGLGEVYEGLDGELYEVQGLAEDDVTGLAEEELQGFAEDELSGIDEADDLTGYGEADDLTGLAGLAEEELQGFAEDELSGIEEADDLTGYGEADELTGLAEDDILGLAEEELQGFAEDDLSGIGQAVDLTGYGEAEDLADYGESDDVFQGIDGYVVAPGIQGLDAYVPPEPPRTRPFVRPRRPPEIWKPLW